MKIAVINTYNSKDINIWAGIPYHLSILFDKVFGNEVSYIQIHLKRNLKSYLKGFYYNRIQKKNYLSWADESLQKKNKKDVQKQLTHEYDLIITYQFFLVPALHNHHNKIIWWSDATFKNLLNFYPYTTNVCGYCIRGGNRIQKQALLISKKIILASNWAVQSAVADYNTDKKKVAEIPFGPNLNNKLSESAIHTIINERISNTINLLFIGINWERKGGDKIVELVNQLNKIGYNTLVHVVGSKIPATYSNDASLIEVGFLNKGKEEDNNILTELFKKCTYLTIASDSECFGIVFCEANSYALPVITTNVGGIPSAVTNGKNGFTFNTEHFVEQAIEVIIKYHLDNTEYKNLCLSAYDFYKENFTWDIIEKKFRSVITDINIT